MNEKYRMIALKSNNSNVIKIMTGADPGFDRGGPDHDRPKLPMVCSSVMRAK